MLGATQATDAEVAATQKQIKAAFDAEQAAKAALACTALEGVAAVSIEGHPVKAHNGIFKMHHSDQKGWPVLKKQRLLLPASTAAGNSYIYRSTWMDEWRVGSTHSPDEYDCAGFIEAREGPLPVGAHTWKCWDFDQGKWEEGTLTVGLLVRCRFCDSDLAFC